MVVEEYGSQVFFTILHSFSWVYLGRSIASVSITDASAQSSSLTALAAASPQSPSLTDLAAASPQSPSLTHHLRLHHWCSLNQNVFILQVHRLQFSVVHFIEENVAPSLWLERSNGVRWLIESCIIFSKLFNDGVIYKKSIHNNCKYLTGSELLLASD